MRLEQLEYLIEISKTGSISLASKNLHISQQSLSKAILNLEDELEVPLLERTSKGVTLTPEGKSAVSKAQAILYDLADFKKSLKPTVDKPAYHLHGNLSILYTNSFDLNLTSTSIHQYSAIYPNITVSINQISMPRLFQALMAKEADLGLVTLTSDYALNQKLVGYDMARFHFSPLSEDRLLVVASKYSPLAKNKSVSINGLLKYPLVLLQHEYHDDPEKNWLYQLLSYYGKPKFILRTNTTELYLKAIQNNTGVGFYTQSSHKYMISNILDDIVILPIRDHIQLFQQYVFTHEHPLSKESQLYLPFLTSNH